MKEDFERQNTGKAIKQYKEMSLHEQIFNHLCFDSASNKLKEFVSVEIAYSFLRVLLDPRKMSKEEQCIMMKGLCSWTKILILRVAFCDRTRANPRKKGCYRRRRRGNRDLLYRRVGRKMIRVEKGKIVSFKDWLPKILQNWRVEKCKSYTLTQRDCSRSTHSNLR